jgi:peptidylprolyl isomerase
MLLKYGTTLLLGIAVGWGAAHRAQRVPDEVARHAQALGTDALGMDDLRGALLPLDTQRRRRLLLDQAAFAAFAERRGQRQVLANAALAARLEAEPATRAALREEALRLLAGRYLERVAPEGDIPAPTDAEIEAFHREHQAAFASPGGLPVWQIFIPAPAAEAERRLEARTRARAVLEALLSGEQSFAEAASRHSAHAPSRENGGYMGLLPLDDLLPEVRAALLNAPQGKAVGPGETAAGFHVVQRGALVPAAQPSLDEVRPRIADLLRDRTLAARRADAVRAAAQSHPVRLDAGEVEGWRQALLEEFSQEAAAENAESSVK